MKNYFVTIDGIVIASNLTKEQAIRLLIKKNKSNSGVGYNKKGKYKLLPLHFYL